MRSTIVVVMFTFQVPIQHKISAIYTHQFSITQLWLLPCKVFHACILFVFLGNRTFQGEWKARSKEVHNSCPFLH